MKSTVYTEELYIREKYPFMLTEKDVEPGGGESKTIPGQSMTVKQMLERHARGLPIQGSRRVPLFEYDEDGRLISRVPQLERLDIAEIEELKNRTWNRIAELEKEEEKRKEERRLEDEKKSKELQQLQIEFEEFRKAKERKESSNEENQ